MNKLLLALLVVLPFMETPVYAQDNQQVVEDRLDRIHDATVRVSVSGGTGTGMVYREDDANYYVLTNQHVVGNANTVGLEFTRNHYPSPRYQGTVTKRRKASGIDVAEVRIAKASLPAGINLPVIPLAMADDPPRELFLVTAGCQAGERPSVQLTLTIRESQGLIYYLPTSRPGRSGSALVNRDGTKIYGLVAWMTGGRDSQGLAMTVDVIRPFLLGTAETVAAADDFPQDAIEIPLAPYEHVEEEFRVLSNHISNCPPDSCLDDNCPWDYQYTMTEEMKTRDNPWQRRFGGPVQPQPRPAQPEPQQPQPNIPQPQDSLPGNPWASPRPQQPSPQEPSPQQPSPQEPNRPRLLGDGELMGRLFERFDRIEPKLDRLEEKVDPILPRLQKLDERTDPSSEEEARRRRLFDRMERIPDKLIGPDDLNQFAERQSDTLLGRVRNLIWSLLQPIIWVWWIVVFVAVWFGANVVFGSLLGPNWLGIILVWAVKSMQKVVQAIGQMFNAVRNPPAPVAEPKKTRKPRAKKPVEKASE